MPTAIPLTVFTQITQTNFFPEIIAYLLNEAEATYSRRRRASNARRVYPFWKMCPVCSQPFPCESGQIADKRKYCSYACYGRWRANDPAILAHMTLIAGKGAAASNAPENRKRKGHPGTRNPAWKGGVTYFKTHGNYVGVKYVRCPAAYLAMARKDGYVMEHRLLVAQAMGRALLRTEVVHHIDHHPTNNALSNLLLFSSNQAHKLYEARGTPAPIWSLSSPSTMTG